MTFEIQVNDFFIVITRRHKIIFACDKQKQTFFIARNLKKFEHKIHKRINTENGV